MECVRSFSHSEIYMTKRGCDCIQYSKSAGCYNGNSRELKGGMEKGWEEGGMTVLPEDVSEQQHLQDQEGVSEALSQGRSPHHTGAL